MLNRISQVFNGTTALKTGLAAEKIKPAEKLLKRFNWE
jgi:hypothetical protein